LAGRRYAVLMTVIRVNIGSLQPPFISGPLHDRPSAGMKWSNLGPTSPRRVAANTWSAASPPRAENDVLPARLGRRAIALAPFDQLLVDRVDEGRFDAAVLSSWPSGRQTYLVSPRRALVFATASSTESLVRMRSTATRNRESR